MRKYLTSILQLLCIALSVQAGQTCAATISEASIEQRVRASPRSWIALFAKKNLPGCCGSVLSCSCCLS